MPGDVIEGVSRASLQDQPNRILFMALSDKCAANIGRVFQGTMATVSDLISGSKCVVNSRLDFHRSLYGYPQLAPHELQALAVAGATTFHHLAKTFAASRSCH